LHEITAIVPLPIIYYTIHTLDLSVPIPASFNAYVEQGNVRMRKMVKYFGFDLDINDDSKVMLELATAYAIVKMMMPLRVGLSVYLAPFFARVAVQPTMNMIKAVFQRP